MPKPLATWNPARDVWEGDQIAICGHMVVWSGIWPLSGTTANGRVYGRPISEPPTDDSERSLLPTPNPFHSDNTETPDEWRARRADVLARTGTRHGPALSVIVQSVMDGKPLLPGGYMPDRDGALMPTPTTQDATNLGGPSQARRKSPGLNWIGPRQLGAPDELDPPGEQLRIAMPGEEPDTDWGPFLAAVRRWEAVLGRPAPAPAEEGPKGTRLAPRFVEWMMGLPDGWVTDVPGLTYRQQLRALGNGVVPQQAAHALRVMGVAA